MRTNIVIFIAIVWLISCSKMEQELNRDIAESSVRSLEEQKTFSEEEKVTTHTENPIENRKIIWSANLEFQVAEVDSATKVLQNLSTRYKGFISNMDMSSTNYRITNTIQIRISNDRFEDLIDAIKQEAIHIDEIQIKSNDVTEEFIDSQSRLKTKKEVRDRYIDILKNKTGNVKDIIAAEETIRKITEEIEAKEGRLRYLQDKVSFSTVVVTIY
ncbi:MAG: DUF4349 domain-containing protein, partial [Bacteroidota bacterium]